MKRPDGIDWYIKWFASIVLIIGAATTAMDMYPYNMYLQFAGVFGWFIVGMLWHDRALIVLNSISLAIYTLGIVNYYYG